MLKTVWNPIWSVVIQDINKIRLIIIIILFIYSSTDTAAILNKLIVNVIIGCRGGKPKEACLICRRPTWDIATGMAWDNAAYVNIYRRHNLSRVLTVGLPAKKTIKASDTLEHQPTVSVWPVPYACAQPYHPGSGSHGQLFRLSSTSQVSRRSMTGTDYESAINVHICRSVVPDLRSQVGRLHMRTPGWVLPENLGGGVRPASQNPYPIYDHNLRYSLPYLWPDQNFETLFMTWTLHQNPVSDLRYNWIPMLNYHIHNLWRAFVDFLFDNDENVVSRLKILPISRLEYKSHTLFMTKRAKIS